MDVSVSDAGGSVALVIEVEASASATPSAFYAISAAAKCHASDAGGALIGGKQVINPHPAA